MCSPHYFHLRKTVCVWNVLSIMWRWNKSLTPNNSLVCLCSLHQSPHLLNFDLRWTYNHEPVGVRNGHFARVLEQLSIESKTCKLLETSAGYFTNSCLPMSWLPLSPKSCAEKNACFSSGNVHTGSYFQTTTVSNTITTAAVPEGRRQRHGKRGLLPFSCHIFYWQQIGQQRRKDKDSPCAKRTT